MSIKTRLYIGIVNLSAIAGKLSGKYPLVWQRQLKAYKDIHIGKTAVLIGNGPSVRTSDLELLKDKVTFCCNKFYLSYPNHSLRPTYTVSADDDMINSFGNEIVSKSAGKVWLCSAIRPRLEESNYSWLYLQSKKLRLQESGIQWGVYHTGATLLAALQIGYYMGIRKFVLYGVDHDFNYSTEDNRTSLSEGNHFISNYREGKAWYVPDTPLIEESFHKIAGLLEEQGGYLINISRKSKLPYVKKMDFDEWLSIDTISEIGL